MLALRLCGTSPALACGANCDGSDFASAVNDVERQCTRGGMVKFSPRRNITGTRDDDDGADELMLH